MSLYSGITALALNLVIVVVLTPLFNLLGAQNGRDTTTPDDYLEDTVAVEPIDSHSNRLAPEATQKTPA